MQTRHAARSIRTLAAESARGVAEQGSPDLHTLRRRLLERVGADRFERYFEGGRAVRMVDGALCVAAGTPFLARILEQRFGEDLRHAAGDSAAVAVRVVVAGADAGAAQSRDRSPVGEDAAPASPMVAAPAVQARPRRRPVASGRGRAATLATLEAFVVGEENRLAFEAAQRLGTGPDTAGVGGVVPVVFTGPCGSGKTHLLQGAAARRRATQPGSCVLYVSAEAFANEYISAVRLGNVDPMRRKYRAADLLCIDDLHALVRNPATQVELQHTLDAIRQRGGCFAVSSADRVRVGDGLRDSLVSRLASGLNVHIGAPGPQTLAHGARSAGARRGLKIEADAADDLVRLGLGGPAPRSVREVEGLVVRLEAVHRLLCGGQGAVSAATVQRARAELARSGRTGTGVRRPVKPDEVLELVCRTIGVSREDVVATGRHAKVVLARAVASKVLRSVTLLSYPEIARVLGRGNHSTIITACQRLDRQVARGERCVLTSAEGAAGEWSIGDLCRVLAERASHSAVG